MFVDFTAAWCVTCQFNKRTTLADAEVQADLRRHAACCCCAPTGRGATPPSRAELARLGRNGVPVYVLYSPGAAGPRLLSEILSVDEVRSAAGRAAFALTADPPRSSADEAVFATLLPPSCRRWRWPARAARPPPPSASPHPPSRAVDTSGKTVSLADFKGKHVVLEWVNPGCPYVQKHYGSANMQGTQKEAAAKGVVWLAVNSTAPRRQRLHGAGRDGAVDAAAEGRRHAPR